MMIQLFQLTPEELEARIFKRLKKELDLIRTEFQPKQPTEFLTRNEVKDLLKIDISTVHNWTRKGKLKAYGISGRIYYKRSEVEQAIKPLKHD